MVYLFIINISRIHSETPNMMPGNEWWPTEGFCKMTTSGFQHTLTNAIKKQTLEMIQTPKFKSDLKNIKPAKPEPTEEVSKPNKTKINYYLCPDGIDRSGKPF